MPTSRPLACRRSCRRLAVSDGIVDLSTDALTPVPPTAGSYRIPQAWSADGRYLATVTYTDPMFPEGYSQEVTGARLDVLDTATGTTMRIADLDTTLPVDGWIAAFAPDGRLAYQTGSEVVVVDRDGTVLSRFGVPDGTRIAGKGAWTRDGRGIAVVDQGGCGCRAAYDSRWTLTTVDASTGAPSGPAYHVDEVVGVRMVGWSPSGRPVVVAYKPLPPGDLNPGTTPVTFRDTSNVSVLAALSSNVSGLESLDDVRAAQLLALDPGGGSRVLTDANAESLDVADDVVSDGVSRAGRPPLLTEDNLIGAAFLAVLGSVVLVVVSIVLGGIRHRRTAAVASLVAD